MDFVFCLLTTETFELLFAIVIGIVVFVFTTLLIVVPLDTFLCPWLLFVVKRALLSLASSVFEAQLCFKFGKLMSLWNEWLLVLIFFFIMDLPFWLYCNSICTVSILLSMELLTICNTTNYWPLVHILFPYRHWYRKTIVVQCRLMTAMVDRRTGTW